MGRGALVAGLLLLGGSALAADGSLRGTVKLVQLAPDGTRKPLPDASKVVVYVPDFDQPAEGIGGTIEQKNKQYVPDVLAIVKGQSVEFVNEDPLLHNVFSSSRAAGANGMDLGKYKGPGKAKSWQFKRTGIIDIYCDIHESMAATVLVLPNPAFKQPDASGHFQIDHVPAGRHVVYAWAKHGQKASADVEVKPGQVTELPPLEVVVTGGGNEGHKDKYGQDYSTHAQAYGQ